MNYDCENNSSVPDVSSPLNVVTSLASRGKIASCSIKTIVEINMEGATIGSVKSTIVYAQEKESPSKLK